MLRVRNLVKRYETKGESVTALNGVSVDFPETGMVFLLGKSGSGKSTLLNVSGGLDSPDAGEIIVKGKSSYEFTPSDFDSYRNTYIGFIFQEYNVLNEFTVKENVALALELQGKPRDEKLIGDILEQVEIADLADRRPNTLSGGQKQRVAIARALVKNPEIIMADEPTGALDSVTGKQVFDTLKKLSQNKLVIVVSHDREFAETYADRIIELKDGSVISDVSREAGTFEQTNLCALSEKKLAVGCGAKLTDEEIEQVCTFLKNGKGKFVISAEENDVKEIHTEQKGGFSETKETHARIYDNDESSFIKSKFPLRHAIRMGLSSLKFKPVRLAFTILLSTVAFIVFGIFSTLITFNANKVAVNSLYESSYTGAVVKKKALVHVKNVKENEERTIEFYTGKNGAHFSQAEIEEFQKNYPQMGFFPAYDMNLLGDLDFKQDSMGYSKTMNSFYRQMTSFRAFADVAAVKDNPDYTLVAGKYPEKENEGLISLNVYEAFCIYGYKTGNGEVLPVQSYEDILGKPISFVATVAKKINLKVVGILDTHETFEEFQILKTESREENGIDLDKKAEKLKSVYLSSISSIAFVSSEFHDFYKQFDEGAEQAQKKIEEYKEIYRFEYRNMKYIGCNYEEPEDAYCQYLIAPLSGNRQEKCKIIMRKINDSKDLAKDTLYKSNTYYFMSDISAGKNIIEDLMPTLGTFSIVLAVFSALLLFNFISVSISGKKKDIGILRAVGARGIDVFKIFFAEALTVTALCFALACFGSLAACAIMNNSFIVKGTISFKLLLFDVLNALLVLAISLVTAIVATILPVRSAVKKKPVEAIRAI